MAESGGNVLGKRASEDPHQTLRNVVPKNDSTGDHLHDENNQKAGEEFDDTDDGSDGDDYSGDEYEGDDFYGDDEDMETDDEDFEEPEYEVEEKTHVVQSNPETTVKLRLHISKEEEFGDWIRNIHVHCTLDGDSVGVGFGRYIRRGRIRARFWQYMEETSKEMSDLAFEIFDRHGFLKENLKGHCIQRGTGVWGSELDTGPLFLIEHMEITEKECRGKGLGRAMVNSLIQKAETYGRPKPEPLTEVEASLRDFILKTRGTVKYSPLHVLVAPGWLEREVEDEIIGKSARQAREVRFRAAESATAFYRSVGFRRIGTSSYFGFSPDPAHTSHEIAVADDADPPTGPLGETLDTEDNEAKRLERLKQEFPLHHATITMPDTECVEFYQKFVAKDDAEWTQVNPSGETLLHIAAHEFKARSAKWLMGNVKTQSLATVRNLEGYTALESLQDHLEVGRTQAQHMAMRLDVSDKFRGFPELAVASLCVLMGIGPSDLTQLRVLQIKYGCTCGSCLEGFMSPRMKLALLSQAGATHDMLCFEFESGYPDWESLEDDMAHVAADVQRRFRTNKSIREGFANTFDLVSSCLRSNTIPTEENILSKLERRSEWPPVTRNYLQAGGEVEAALARVFEKAEQQDTKAGDGTFEEAMEDELSKLSTCRNDHEFGFVAWACGIPGLPRSGGYC
ncbi:hypothetical protein FQN54_006917 [Arachnomyces sp. PD_36]|nr:hypothetical protein FQN54_006917 [Arachnomyces sp. PD_36]